MPTKKAPRSGRASVKRAVRGTRKAKTAVKKKPARVAPKAATKRPTRASGARATSKPARATSKATRPQARENAAVSALKARFQRERNGLEKNLTDAVREIGLLRHHELRVTQLERQLQERDETITRLQSRLAELERRPVEPVYEDEVQHSFALPASAPELDEFEDDNPLAEDSSLAEEDEI